MKRSFVLLIAAGSLSGSLLLGAAHAGGPKSGQPVNNDELPSIIVSNLRLQARDGTPSDPGNVRLDGEVLNHSSTALTEVVLRVSLTAPDSDEVQVDRRLHVASDPAIPVEASELLAKSFTLPEAVKETLSQRKLSVSVVAATKPQEPGLDGLPSLQVGAWLLPYQSSSDWGVILERMALAATPPTLDHSVTGLPSTDWHRASAVASQRST